MRPTNASLKKLLYELHKAWEGYSERGESPPKELIDLVFVLEQEVNPQ